MTWDAYHCRKDAVREIVAIADRQRDLTLTELLDLVDVDRATFTNETELLCALQMNWFQRLSGQLDRLMDSDVNATEITDSTSVAVAAWIAAAVQIPVVRVLLDRHREEPALSGAFAHELIYLAAAVGAPATTTEMLARGQRIVEEARDLLPGHTPQVAEPARAGLMTRLRNAIAA